MELPSSWKVIVFTINLLVGLLISQIVGATMEKDVYKTWMDIVISLTMWCLSFIMINVGYEFTIDKKALGDYGWDYLIAMTAAGFPWLFVALWFFFALPSDMKMSKALLVARFAAPTSAGILFSMLDAAGLKDTWVFQKARILAIFDDLDTILLMIPLKVILVGFKWELILVIGIMVVLLLCSWFKLHALKIPYSAGWTLFYAAIIAAVCKVIHVVTHYHLPMETIHIEVLLPAFVLGTMVDTPCARHELELQRRMSSLRRSRTMGNLGSTATLNATTTEVHPAMIAEAPEGQECGNSEDTEDSIVRLDSKGQKAKQAASMTVPGLVIHEADDHVEPVSVGQDPTSQDAGGALRVVALAPEAPGTAASSETVQLSDAGRDAGPSAASAVSLREAANTAAWPEKNLAEKETKVSRLAPTPPDHRSVSKQSKQSNASNASKASSRSLTRYGHAREDVYKSSLTKAEAKTGKRKKEPEAEPDPEPEEAVDWEEVAATGISMVFMVLVGLSMPALIGKNAKDNTDGMSAGTIVFHVILVSILMIIGKMFPVFCYRDEAPVGQRTALCLGMCPRGEVGASIIVISLELGVDGPSIIISMCALGGNLVMSGFFIAMVKYLLKGAPPLGMEGGEQVIQTQ